MQMETIMNRVRQGMILVSFLAVLYSCTGPADNIVPPPPPIDTYDIHKDGGLIYNPLFRQVADSREEREEEGEVQRIEQTLQLGKYTLRYTVPTRATGYDILSIPYTISWTDTAEFPLAIEATAFEEPSRRNGQDLFDLALPDDISIQVDYLGSITAHMKPGRRHNIKPDMSDEPGIYPGFDRNPFTRSGIVESGDIIWFRFRVTNSGNTILDPEGFGGWGLFPELRKKDENNEYTYYSQHRNLYIRDLGYLYPGESHDFWVNFTEKGSRDSYRIDPGDYKIMFRTFYRNYKEWNDPRNYWNGEWMFIGAQPISVKDNAGPAPVAPMEVSLIDGDKDDKISRYIHTFEEFMTSFDCWQNADSDSINGMLHLQVAPWTKEIVIKLIATDPVQCRTLLTINSYY